MQSQHMPLFCQGATQVRQGAAESLQSHRGKLFALPVGLISEERQERTQGTGFLMEWGQASWVPRVPSTEKSENQLAAE